MANQLRHQVVLIGQTYYLRQYRLKYLVLRKWQVFYG